ncbi:MAG TPA: DUF255 domain-containing protein [Chitinophagales bacterium]|nr:DUF255 domain-containing protein [Chitinophagales bacterium]
MHILKSFLSISLVFLFVSCNNNSNAASGESNKSSDGIQWMTFEEAVHKAQTDPNPKNIFIDFYTDWCGWCKVMDRKTFADGNVIELMNKYFYPVKFDAEGKETVEFMGKEYGFVASGRNGYHQLAAEIMQGKLSYPTFVFLTPEFQIITPIAGFVPAEDFEPIVNYLGQNLHENAKDNDWENYKSNYKRGQK